MAVEDGSVVNHGERRKVLVGIQINENTSELLKWAISRVAEPGDSVVAVHICRHSDPREGEDSSLCSLDSYVALFEDLCHLKKVNLVGQIFWGNSVKRVLVREAKLCTARTLVVGASKSSAFGGMLSLAQYCARKLVSYTTVIAVQEGKVVFWKDGKKRPGLKQNHWPNIRSLIGPSTEDSEVQNRRQKEISDFKCSIKGLPLKKKDVGAKSDGTEPESLASSANISKVGCELVEEVEDEHYHGAQELRCGVSSISIKRLPEDGPGWPLLQRSETAADTDAHDMSVVKWAMSLPNRHSYGNEEHGQNERTSNHSSAWLELLEELETIMKNSSTQCRIFNREELERSISQISSENLIGKGGCSQVYKGCLPDGQPVALKMLKSTKTAWESFLTEVRILTSLQHENIAPLLGICVDDKDLISIYRLYFNGSLDEHLYREGKKSVLPWEVRCKVAAGVAEALTYLHNDFSTPVIHRDIKSSNILLSHEFEPQLSDFGLSLRSPTNSAFVTNSDVVGTLGYLAPEYVMYGKVSEKIDVYSYGVLLLELLSGRKPISTDNRKAQQSLVMWATSKLKSRNAVDILDPNLSKKLDEKQMQRMVLAAMLCITRTAERRPRMIQILKLLQGDEETVNWAKCEVNNIKEESDSHDKVCPVPRIQPHQMELLSLEGDDTGTAFVQQREQTTTINPGKTAHNRKNGAIHLSFD